MSYDRGDGYQRGGYVPQQQQLMQWTGPGGMNSGYGGPQDGVSEAVEYFRHHLLVRDYRPQGKRAGDPHAEQCVQDFRRFVEYVKHNFEDQGVLDLQTFDSLCRRFSDEWQGTAHWLNHRILSKYLTEKLGIRWKQW
eukprot:TRINITY_DN4092_c0_g1_i2.p2 TRINITY_DN4092_c0_g1~~TRINITY_DN4092_c0_g1_i2.p2  ORF type:complete len:137 (+),score=32.00 TRINITY_DN4092_c0_g1_i2:131-541(+)